MEEPFHLLERDFQHCFLRGGKPEKPDKIPRSKDEDQNIQANVCQLRDLTPGYIGDRRVQSLLLTVQCYTVL